MAPILNYFAAANGFDGFKSYFDKVFHSYSFERIIILKGGPGTGKSTFMKRIAEAFSEIECGIERIYCSSDPKSLDGVIIKNDGKRVAVIDGTSPHATDPTAPGACERILNLGDFWNESILLKYSETIKNGTKIKAKHYNTAYSYLNLAGAVDSVVSKEIDKIYVMNDSSVIKELLVDIDARGSSGVRLINAFSKDGFTSFNTLGEMSKRIKYAVGIYGSEYVFMRHLKRRADAEGYGYLHFPSPMSAEKTDALSFNNGEVTFVVENQKALPQESVIDTSEFIDKRALNEMSDMFTFLWHEREVFFWNAQDEFKKAADEHFKLEKIYSSAMNFEMLNTAVDKTIGEIKEIFNYRD